MTTKTYFTTQGHRYTTDMGGDIECSNPKTCRNGKHWYDESSEQHETMTEALEAAEGDDAPAVRIFQTKVTVEREVIDTIGEG